MRNYLLSALFMLVASLNAFAYDPNDLASSVISSEADTAVEIVKLYNAQLKDPHSKISKGLADIRSLLIDVNASDLVLLQSGQSAGVYTASFLLPIRTAWKSQTTTERYITAEYVSDMTEEEIGLSTRIYLTGFANVIVKPIKK
jgi:hypothetical protein